MSYVKYANLCAEMVRVSLKEPFLTKVCASSVEQMVPGAESGDSRSELVGAGEAQGDGLFQGYPV